MRSFAVNQVLYLFYTTLVRNLSDTLHVFILILHSEAHQSALPYLLSSKTIRENQEDSGSFLLCECLLQTLETFIDKRRPQILSSLLTVLLTAF